MEDTFTSSVTSPSTVPISTHLQVSLIGQRRIALQLMLKIYKYPRISSTATIFLLLYGIQSKKMPREGFVVMKWWGKRGERDLPLFFPPRYKNYLHFDKISQGIWQRPEENFKSKMPIKFFKILEWNRSQNVTGMARYASAVERCCIKVMFKEEPNF